MRQSTNFGTLEILEFSARGFINSSGVIILHDPRRVLGDGTQPGAGPILPYVALTAGLGF